MAPAEPRTAIAIVAGGCQARPISDDPQIEIRRVPALFPEAQSEAGKRRNLGTFKSRAAAEKHERAVQYFKRH
jgi:hypothetical protein